MTILFLDFDGVLHSMAGPVSRHYTTQFEHVQPLADLLEAFPHVKIVISSSWRHAYSLHELQAMLGVLGRRVAGVTGSGSLGSRYEEIRATAYKQGPWVAIDDDHAGWREADRARLVATSPALALGEEGKLGELDAKLRAAELVHRVIEEYAGRLHQDAGILQFAELARAEFAISGEEVRTLRRLSLGRDL